MSRNSGRNTDGAFASGNPGKPKGTRHKATQAALALLEGEGAADGELTPIEGAHVVALTEGFRRTPEVSELEARCGVSSAAKSSVMLVVGVEPDGSKPVQCAWFRVGAEIAQSHPPITEVRTGPPKIT